jgi:hypothetical protein
MNPDVFPYHADFIARHDAVVEGCPAPQTDLFGVPLYYDDGSLMHAGMHVEVDRLPHLGAGARAPTQVLRVEHYGKGAPAETARFLAPRAVPAVTARRFHAGLRVRALRGCGFLSEKFRCRADRVAA